MIFSEPKSELHVRLHIAEMLKDKIENDNYSELCAKMFIWVTNGIVLPPTAKDPLEETMLNLSKAIQNGGNITDMLPSMPKMDNKEQELKELAEKYKGVHIIYREYPCHICGYSIEFDCLIAGTEYNIGKNINLDDSDCLIVSTRFPYYLYVPKDIVKE